jgi:hypothetical protein
MTRDEFFTAPAAKRIAITSESDTVACEALERPNEPANFSGVIREARETDEYTEFLHDPNSVLKGAMEDDDGFVSAIFWERRTV